MFFTTKLWINLKIPYTNKGPCGTRLLNEKLVFHIGEQVQEMKKLVHVNKSVLTILRGSLDQPEEMKKKLSELVDVQVMLQVCNTLQI